MSAAQLGRNLLAEIEEVSLNQFLQELRTHIGSEQRTWTGVTQIDSILDVLLPSPGLASRPPIHHSIEIDDDVFAGPTVHGSVQDVASKREARPVLIEFDSCGSHAGTINFLNHLTALSILPRTLDAREACVVWLDTTFSFSIRRLYGACVGWILNSGSSVTPSEASEVTRQALKHVHVFSVQSTSHLQSILETLPAYLLQQRAASSTNTVPDFPGHYSSNRPLALVVLDSTSTFYWPDRFTTELDALESANHVDLDTPRRPPRNAREEITTKILAQFKMLSNRFACPVLYTTNHSLTTIPNISNHSVSTTSALQTQPPPNQSFTILSPWTTNATLSLYLTSISTPQFGSFMTLEECLRDRQKRADVVSRSRARISLNETWLERTIRDVERRRQVIAAAKGGFVISTTATGGIIVG